MAHAAAAPAPGPVLGCPVELHLSFADLKGEDVLTESDPFAELFVRDPRDKHGWTKVGQTAPMRNLHTGSWAEGFDVNFRFEEVQTLLVKVWDHDRNSRHDFLGQASLTLGTVMGAAGQRVTVALERPSTFRSGTSRRGAITVLGEKRSGNDGFLRLHMRAHNLDSKDWGGLGRSDPYYVLQRDVAGSFVSIFQSEYHKSNNSPIWKEHGIPLDKLCRGDLSAQLRIQVFDYDEGSKHDLIGECLCSAQTLLDAAKSGAMLEVRHPPTRRKYQKSSYKNSGQLQVLRAELRASPQARMLDYIAGGTNINMVVAVDFTASNGPPTSTGSLHSLGVYPNQYEAAIAAVGNILQPYDSDGRIAAYGFGGVFRGSTSHSFPLNGITDDPEVQGVPGLLQAYRAALQNVPLSGPTYFAPLLDQVNRSVFNPELSQWAQSYTVLLILTDGAILDMQPTIDRIVEGSSHSLSIIIVGVGSADMSAMHALDADDKRLKASNGRSAARDIVQFVQFSECKNDGEALARRTLAELPAQMVEFFEAHGINPNPPRPAAPSAVVLESTPVSSMPNGSPPQAGLAHASPASAPMAPQMATAVPAGVNLAHAGKTILAQAYQL